MNRLYRKPGRKTGSRGFTLIEILVAVTILSIGLLGLAGLQTTALRNNQASLMRTQASLLAYDMADRMRANLSAVGAGSYDSGTTTPAVTSGCSSLTGCDTTAMAANDLAEWNAAVAAALPSGESYLCIDSTPNDGTGTASPACDGNGNVYAIKLWWDNDRDGTITSDERFTMSFQP